ncbi:hypothetical protein AB6A40_006176 [Gnathostoma spinigerum]|uniref:Uncharacterized protein n=1 Tax=Gnathostoma spinigerum TaxID=75299 RepID=A0ABD6EJT1_9BILA
MCNTPVAVKSRAAHLDYPKNHPCSISVANRRTDQSAHLPWAFTGDHGTARPQVTPPSRSAPEFSSTSGCVCVCVCFEEPSKRDGRQRRLVFVQLSIGPGC